MLAAGVAAGALALLACSGELVPLGNGGGGGGGADAGSTGGALAYRPGIQQDLESLGCTATSDCHGADGVPMSVEPAPADDQVWMANYDEVVARAGTPTSSLLLTRPTGLGGHLTVLSASSPILSRWRSWIEDGSPYQP